jgi:hypothetical protein
VAIHKTSGAYNAPLYVDVTPKIESCPLGN